MKDDIENLEELYQSLFETMAEGVVIINTDGQIFQANPSAERILGLKRSEIESLSYIAPEWKIFRPDGTPMPPNEMASPREMKEKLPVKDIVMGVKRPDGTISWINVNAVPLIIKNKFTGIVSTFTDITERKQAEKALWESEKQWRSLFEDSRDPIYIITREGRFIEVNQAMIELFDYTREELLMLNVLELYINSEDRATFQKEIERTGSVRDYEVKLRKKDGTEISCLLTSTVRYANDRSILGYQGIIRDITEQKLAEDALHTSKALYKTLASLLLMQKKS